MCKIYIILLCRYGPDSGSVKESIRSLDTAIGNLIDHLSANNKSESVNIIVASDYGLTATRPENTVDLSSIIDWRKDVIWARSDLTNILVKPRRAEKVNVITVFSSHLNGICAVY